MWSFSLAGSMLSSTALIGRGVGVGVSGAEAVGTGLPLAARGEGDPAGGALVPPQEARTIASTMRSRPTVPVYRGRGEISASA